MSKIAFKGNASGTGTLTFEAPNTNTDRTINIPDEAGSVLTSASDLAAANLTGNVAAARITDALNAGGSAPIYACRAWVNFNGTGTVAIRESGNVSSITDEGTGDYTVNFTTAMEDVNYSCLIAVSSNTPQATNSANHVNIDSSSSGTLFTTTGFRFGVLRDNGGGASDTDTVINCVSVFR